jgi:hypothetical protein
MFGLVKKSEPATIDLIEPAETKFIEIPICRGLNFDVRKLIKLAKQYNAIIAGGYARYMGSQVKEPVTPTDIDIFTRTEESCEQICLALYELGYEVKLENSTFINFSKEDPMAGMFGMNPYPVQVIKPNDGRNLARRIITTGDATELISQFDFSIIRAAVLNEDTLLVDEDFLRHEKESKIVIKYIKDSYYTLRRIIKYGLRGYAIEDTELIKILTNWNSEDENFRKQTLERVLKNQNVIAEKQYREEQEKQKAELKKQVKEKREAAKTYAPSGGY